MDEVRRFARFTLPGMSSLTLLMIALAFTDGTRLTPLLSWAKPEKDISTLLGGVLASSALGYLFSVIYFAIIDVPWVARRFAADHRAIFVDLSHVIELKDAAGKTVSPKSMTQSEAWATFVRFWYARLETCPVVKGFTPYSDRLVDVMHGIGATAFGTMVAAGAWFFIHFLILGSGVSWQFLAATPCWGIIVLALWRSHRRVVTTVSRTAYANMADLVNSEYATTGRKVTIWFVR